MEKIKIVCPNCNSLLSVGNTPGIGEKMLSCPVCSFRAKIAVFQQHGSGKNNSPASDDDEPTHVNFDMMDRTIGSLFFGDEEYSLHKGENTVGRRAKSGHAEVQISDDRYMSRQHAVIVIKEGASSLEHHLQPTNPKNPIKVNGKQIENTDVIILNWGDRLTFGRTELLFDRPNSDEEKTLVQ